MFNLYGDLASDVSWNLILSPQPEVLILSGSVHVHVGVSSSIVACMAGDKSDMSNYRGITVGSVIARLFAMILEQRIASWAEKQGVKAKGQAGFRKDFRTTDNIFILRSLIEKQRQTRQKGRTSKLYCCFGRRLILYLVLCCGRCWRNLVFAAESWTSSSPCMHTTAQQCGLRTAYLRVLDA